MRFTLVFIATLSVLLLGMESVLRTWFVSPDFKRWDPELGRLNREGARIVWAREGWGSRDINSLGLVGPEPALEPDGRRVVLLGNSFTLALQVSRIDSFEGGIEARLPGFEVVNAAHEGWSMAHELVLLERIAPVLDPDAIVAQISDLSLFNRSTLSLRHGEDGWEVKPAPPPRDLRAAIKVYTDPLASRSALVRMLLERLNTLRRSQAERLRAKFRGGGGGSAPTKEAQPATMEALQRERSAKRWIVQRMQAQGKPLILLLIPSLEYGIGTCTPSRPKRREMAHDMARELSVPLVDPTDRFCADYLETSQPLHGFHNVVMGEGHLNAAGHRIIADELADAIGRIVR